MAVLRKLAAGAAALGLSTLMAGTAFASAGQWTGSQQHYNVYSTYRGVVSEQTFMPPTYVDRFDMATSVIANIKAYNQSNKEEVRLCYTKPYDYSIIACSHYEEINGSTSIQGIGNFYAVDANGDNETGGLYLNVSAKGNFTVQHRFLDGLQQSLLGDTGRDSIVVNYATD